jgi:hypothetical protein
MKYFKNYFKILVSAPERSKPPMLSVSGEMTMSLLSAEMHAIARRGATTALSRRNIMKTDGSRGFQSTDPQRN